MPRKLSRWTVAVSVTLGLFVGWTSLAGAAELPVSGSLTGTARILGPECEFIGLGSSLDGGLSSIGDSHVEVIACTLGPTAPNHWPISDGNFTITTAEGTITGDVGGY